MTEPARTTFTREDIITGLRELVQVLHGQQHPVRVRIVGGAAIALTVYAARASTADIDAASDPDETVQAAAHAIALRHNWREDWINDAAAVFLPTGLGSRSPSWRPIHHDEQIAIEVAEPETLLAMKLHAAQIRGNRDADDLTALLPLCGIHTVTDAEQLYEQYYPGDGFTPRTVQLVRRLLDQATPAPAVPELPTLG